MRVLFLSVLPVLPILWSSAAFPAPSVERGEYLVTGPAACGNCHTPFDEEGPLSRPLGGGLVIDIPPFTAYASNITPAGRIADWTDDELAITSDARVRCRKVWFASLISERSVIDLGLSASIFRARPTKRQPHDVLLPRQERASCRSGCLARMGKITSLRHFPRMIRLFFSHI